MSFICNFNNRSTLAYKFSVYNKNDPDLIALQEMVKDHNKRNRDYVRTVGKVTRDINIQRVRLMARGPRKIWSLQDYNSTRAYQAYLPHKYAEYFDVYVDEDVDARTDLIREVEEGLSRAQYNKILDLEHRARMLRFEGQQRAKIRSAA